MANPQKENGHVDIAHDVLERLCSISLSGSEFRVILFILRKTWGWHKKEDNISITQITKITQLNRKTVCDCINRLVTKRLLVKTKGAVNTYQFNKDFDQWLVTKRPLGSYEMTTTQLRNDHYSLVTKRPPTKETNTKEIESLPAALSKTFLKKKCTESDDKDHSCGKCSLTPLNALMKWEVARDLDVPLKVVYRKEKQILEMIECGDFQRKYKKDKTVYFTLRNWLRGDLARGFIEHSGELDKLDLPTQHPDEVARIERILKFAQERRIIE